MPENYPQSSDGLAITTKTFPRVPFGGLAQPDYTVRVTTIGLAAGAANYIVSSEYISHAASTFANEASALAMAGSFAIFASMKNLKSLCSDMASTPREKRINVFRGGTGGLTLGASLAAATSAALLSPFDGGLLLVCTLGGFAFGNYKNYTAKEKVCPHPACGMVADCSRTICPNCNLIYYPDTKIIDCQETPVLYWYRVASHMQNLGLKYEDSVLIASKYENEWGLLDTRGGKAVLCKTYLKWMNENIEQVLKPTCHRARRQGR